jgi:hypothetical protein
MDVLSQASQFSPGDFGTNYNTVGAGPGVWTLITSGNFTCLGLGTTTLSLVPGPLDGQLVYGLGGGAEYPTVANGDSVEITQTPEPATMAFLGLGVCGVLFRRRR